MALPNKYQRSDNLISWLALVYDEISSALTSITSLGTRVTTLEGQVPTLGTPQATTSGTAIDFTGIPSWATIIIVSLVGVSTNGTAVIRLRPGTGGSPATTGYLGTSTSFTGATVGMFTAGFDGQSANAAAVRHGSFILTKENATSHIWSCNFCISRSDTAAGEEGAGTVTLSGALDMVRLTTSNGTDAFDAGAVNIWYA